MLKTWEVVRQAAGFSLHTQKYIRLDKAVHHPVEAGRPPLLSRDQEKASNVAMEADAMEAEAMQHKVRTNMWHRVVPTVTPVTRAAPVWFPWLLLIFEDGCVCVCSPSVPIRFRFLNIIPPVLFLWGLVDLGGRPGRMAPP